ncbi:MAG TPA: DUF3854 domain-containing protein [Syntrophales bacterium]|jgi:hypothetical protein|nr:DUF3854 domain-containing protein [Syntrophales bacterium]
MENFHPDHLADLRKSGLSDETILTAGIATVVPGNIHVRLGFDLPTLRSMYEIPYGGGFSRYRCFYGNGENHPKYLQKRGSGNHLYVPPLAARILSDATKPLYITEGEKKALKACQEGLPCVGLGGLWSWSHKGGELIPDFENVALKDRRVFIVPDNDYRKPDKHGYKKNLEQAVSRFAHALVEKGAKVAIVELPDGSEKGLDDYLCAHTLDEFHQIQKIDTSATEITTNSKDPKTTISERLIELTLSEAELFHGADSKPYATIRKDGHPETYPLRSRGFRAWLSGRYWQEYRKGCKKQVIEDALATLEGHAIHEGLYRPVYVRVANCADRIYLDLGSNTFEVVEIAPEGWKITTCQDDVKFLRPNGMAALPHPKEGGGVEDLKKYVNLANPEDFPLIVGYIIGCFHPAGPYPILAVTGEQGSAKSTLLRVIKNLSDPSTAPLRSVPKDLRDLAISASNMRVLSFDNLSEIPVWLSDGLCRLATGGGFATRTLYSDDEETIFDAKRPIMLNCIDNVIRRHDLADRAITINLAVIPEARRIPEQEFWDRFNEDTSAILGAILDAVSCALKNVDRIQLNSHPRMADFAKWVTAAEESLGWMPETFLNLYRQNIQDMMSLSLDADMVGTAVLLFMDGKTEWQGTATELLNQLEEVVDERTSKAKGWPRGAHILSGRMKRAATALRAQGISVTFGKRSSRERLITLQKVGNTSVTSVTEVGNSIYHTDITRESTMTLPFDGSVIGASDHVAERHASQTKDTRDAPIPATTLCDMKDVLI